MTQGSQTRTFAYDSLKRLASATNPESGTIKYTYDAAGNLLTKTDARNVTTNNGYDALNRIAAKSYPSGTPNVSYSYDAAGVTNGIGHLASINTAINGNPLATRHSTLWGTSRRATNRRRSRLTNSATPTIWRTRSFPKPIPPAES